LPEAKCCSCEVVAVLDTSMLKDVGTKVSVWEGRGEAKISWALCGFPAE